MTRGRLVQLRRQRDDVLLRLITAPRADDIDTEGAVLPEHVVRHRRLGQPAAVGIDQEYPPRVTEARRAHHEPRQRLDQVRRVGHRHQTRRLRTVRRVGDQAQRVLRVQWVRRRGAARRRRRGIDRAQCLEQHARGRGRVVGRHRIVDERHLQRVLHRHATAVPSRHVVGDDVVGDGHAIPLRVEQWERTHLGAVQLLQAQAAATAALGAVTHDEVRVDHKALADTVTDPWRAIDVDNGAALQAVGQNAIVVGTGDGQAAAVGRQGRVDALVEEDPVVGDRAVEGHAGVHHAGPVAAAQVAGDPVVIDRVVVGTGTDRNPARARRRAREQRVADRGVVDDHVVVQVVLHVQLTRDRPIGRNDQRPDQAATGTAAERRAQRRRRDAGVADGAVVRIHRRCFTVAQVDGARQRAVVAVDAGVGDLEVVVPAVLEDGATALRAVDDAHAIDARRVALEVGGAVVGFRVPVRASGSGAVRGRVPQVPAAIRERAGNAGRGLPPEVGAGTDVDATASDRDAGAFIGAHQCRLLEDLRQVSVAASVPADEGFERDAIDLHEHAARAAVGAARIVGGIVRVGRAVDGEAEQARHLPAP